MTHLTGVDPAAIGAEVRLGRASRENAATKAMRLLVSGRVLIRYAGPQGIRAFVRGDSASMRQVSYVSGRWDCDCRAKGDCSHLLAVMAVTVVTDQNTDQQGGST